MKNNTRKPLILAGALVLALITALAATFAWFSSSNSVTNKLTTNDGLASVTIQETFIPPADWKPGQSVTKEVAMANTGTAPALVRISFTEMLKVNMAPAGEIAPFDMTQETATKRPVLFNNAGFSSANGWFQVTTTANGAQGGIKLAADYETDNDVVVYAKYVAAGAGVSGGSYSFAAWSPISGTGFGGQLQAITYDQAFDTTSKVLTISNIRYLAYQGALTANANWTATPPALIDYQKSLAETDINTNSVAKDMYPNNIQFNYANIATTPTADKWYYNAADGYFYYCGIVAPGSITPNVLSSLLLKSAANSMFYANLEFDLKVKSDALQNTKDALAASWTTVAANTALNTLLQGVCE